MLIDKTESKLLIIACQIIFLAISVCAEPDIPAIVPRVVSILPHDPHAFTQGLEFKNGKLHESTGLYGMSSLRILDTTGKIINSKAVPDVFAEGCTIFNNHLYQLTWKEMQCILYSFPDLTIKGVKTYTGEGWGLTNDTKYLIMSNGSDSLYYRNTNFEIVKKLPITLKGIPLKNLNELEFARGHIFANVWYDNNIYEIMTSTGNVIRIINCNPIVEQEKIESDQNVLNGIAYIPLSDQFFITGKNWKHIYKVKIPR